MFLGVLIGRKSYSAQKYLFVFIIVFCIGSFMFKDKYDQKDGEDPLIGGCFIAVSLLMDGMTGAFQDRARSFSKPSSMTIMFNVNFWSTVILVAIMSVTGEGREMIEFAQRHHSVIWHLALAILVGTFGQIFISLMISNFGSLPLSLVTTTRKFFTVFISVLVFENQLTTRQWISAGIIFLALLLDSIFTKKSSSRAESETSNSQSDDDEESKVKSESESEPDFKVEIISEKTLLK
jgi:solute carrier family 35 (UDP-galactose transporter), member B1